MRISCCQNIKQNLIKHELTAVEQMRPNVNVVLAAKEVYSSHSWKLCSRG